MKAVKLLVCAAFAAVAACSTQMSPTSPTVDLFAMEAPAPFVGENGLSGAARAEFYHLAEGSELFPFAWVRAMNSVKTGRPFLENLSRFGLIADEKSEANPYSLPIGVTVAERKGTGVEMLGVNCAACHVGQLERNGLRIRVDGAPNMFDVVGFYSEISDSIEATFKSPTELFAFLRRLRQLEKSAPIGAYGHIALDDDGGEQAEIRPETASLLDAFDGHEALAAAGELERALAAEAEALVKAELEEFELDVDAYVASVETLEEPAEERVKAIAALRAGSQPLAPASAQAREGIVRTFLDDVHNHTALALSYAKMLASLQKARDKGTPTGFGRADAFGTARYLLFGVENLRPLTAPSSFPFIWNFGRQEWVHYVANTNSVIERNIGQALGLGGSVDTKTFETTIQWDNLDRLEKLGYRITPPVWDEAVLGPIDHEKAARGWELYQQNCAKCHEAFETTREGLIDYKLFSLETVGTDMNEAINWVQPVFIDSKTFGMGEAHQATLGAIAQAFYKSRNMTPDEIAKWNSGRTEPAVWRDTMKVTPRGVTYPAKPLAGVWATAPYLHNGSVPTLHDLLLQVDQRPKTFPVGQREYDPAKLGYKIEGAPSWAFLFDTSVDGNRNSGHEFGTTLSEEDRAALLEYIKTITTIPAGPPTRR